MLKQTIVDILNNNELRLSDGYKWYGGQQAIQDIAEEIYQEVSKYVISHKEELELVEPVEEDDRDPHYDTY